MRLGIVRKNGLGDLLMAIPLILRCREIYPHAAITLFVEARNAPLLPYLQGFDHEVVMGTSRNKYVALAATAWRCRKLQFDLVISARPTPMQWSNLFLGGLNATHRRAVVDGAWHSLLIDEPMPYDPTAQRHQAVKCLRLIDPSAEEISERLIPKLQITPSLAPTSHPKLLVSVTNRRQGSQLGFESLIHHLRKASMCHTFEVIFSGHTHDLQRMAFYDHELPFRARYIPTPNFPDFLQLIADADAVWSGDGGVMHLAAALDRPQLVLFGKTALWEWAPLTKKAICLRHPENVNLLPEQEIQQGLDTLLHGLRKLP